jgi:type III secretory pathway component EscU
MSKPLVERIPFAKIVTILAACFGVGLGLCGLDYFLVAHGSGRTMAVLASVGFLCAVVMVLSFLGLVVSGIAWGVLVAVRSFGPDRDQAELHTLFGTLKDTKRDDDHEDR